MKATLSRSYKSSKGNTVFVYSVSGNPSDLEAFATAQGDYHRVDETTGTPLWFTTRCIGQTGTLLITSNGKVVPDMSAFDQAASLAAQYGGNLGEQLARSAAEALLGKSSPATTPAQVPQNTDPAAM
jgi:hypothetical protein